MSEVIQCPQCDKKFRLGGKIPATFACTGCGTLMDLSDFGGQEAAPAAPAAPSRGGAPAGRRSARGGAPSGRRSARGGGGGGGGARRSRGGTAPARSSSRRGGRGRAAPQDDYDDEPRGRRGRQQKSNAPLIIGSVAAVVAIIIVLVVMNKKDDKTPPVDPTKKTANAGTAGSTPAGSPTSGSPTPAAGAATQPAPEGAGTPAPGAGGTPAAPGGTAAAAGGAEPSSSPIRKPTSSGKGRYKRMSKVQLQVFPYGDDIDAETQAKAEEGIKAMYLGGRDWMDAQEWFVAQGRPLAGRLVSEFKTIQDSPGFGDRMGRSYAGAIDATLRKIDGFIERKMKELKPVRHSSSPDFVKRIAQRWTWWWEFDEWKQTPRKVWDPFEDESDASETGIKEPEKKKKKTGSGFGKRAGK